MHYRFAKFGFLLLLALLMSACASQVPLLIRVEPANNPSQAEVRAYAANYLEHPVRWGGTIIETGNQKDRTWLTVLGQPLYEDGEPHSTDDSVGRFIAIVPEFLDPKIYAPDRQITVTGTLLPNETGKVGEFTYTYPVIRAAAWYLWPVKTERPYGYGDPWYYRPWYDPWYPYDYPYYY